MALSLRFAIAQSLTDGTVINWTDATGSYNATSNPGGYGAPNIESVSVNATRLIFGNYPDESTAGVVGSLTAFTEYTFTPSVSDPTFAYDGKTLTAETTFIPQVDVSSVGTATIVNTGRTYCYINPTITDPLSWGVEPIYPSQMLFQEDVYPDRVYDLQYEIYTTARASGALIAGTQYIVVGSQQTDTIGYNNGTNTNTYRAGEVFTCIAGHVTFTSSGSPLVYEYNTLVQNSFVLTYNINNDAQLLTALSSTFALGSKQHQDLMQNIIFMNADITAVTNGVTPYKLDISGTQSLIDYIEENYTRLNNIYAQ